jgi:hypothetical protein
VNPVELQSDSRHLARSRAAKLGERQHVAIGVHVPIAADTSVVLPQLLEQVRERLSVNKDASDQVQQRRTRWKRFMRGAKKISQEWIEKTWDVLFFRESSPQQMCD